MSGLYINRGAKGRYRVATPSEICEAASAYLIVKAAESRPHLGSPSKAMEFLRFQGGLDHEQFGIVYLDNRHRVIKVEVLFVGTIDGSSVHPRMVARGCLTNLAAAVVFFHNHPSGIAEPSHADELITTRLKEALALIDVRVMDHIIFAGDSSISFAERGLL